MTMIWAKWIKNSQITAKTTASLYRQHVHRFYSCLQERLPRKLRPSNPRKKSKANTSVQTQQRYLTIHPVIAEALRQNRPVVALESTIITHGMPYPDNINTALEVEAVIREQDAIPATIGIVEGELTVGLTSEQIKFLGTPSKGVEKLKTSRRDLSYVLSKGISGGTTVSGTMVAAQKAGIPIFVTGGIGGVHRGATETFDISADLTELGRTPVAVVCAGVKSILDITLTLEYLETQGVSVVAYGNDKEFPAFFTAKSGFKAPFNLQSPKDVAQMIDENLSLGLESGMVIGVPIPEAGNSLGQEIEDAIQSALKLAKEKNITGKEVTPFILDQINQMTHGKSLAANISLIKNNALVGARIAVELSNLQNQRSFSYSFREPNFQDTTLSFSSHGNRSRSDAEENRIKSYDGRPVLIGGCNFDLLAVTDGYDVLAEVTNKGKLYQTFGGVARNIAECLTRLEHDPLLISAIGVDSPGDMILENLSSLKMDTRGIMVTPEFSTASYSAIMNNGGELLMGVGDMDIHDQISPEYIQDFEEDIKNAPIVLVDGNLTTQAIESTLKLCKKHSVPVWFEPADISKARKPFTTDLYNAITYISPNKRELQSIHATLRREQEGMVNFNSEGPFDFKGPSEDQVINMCVRMGRHVLGTLNCLVVTLGRYGVLILRDELCDEKFPLREQFEKLGLVSATHYPSMNEDLLPRTSIKSVSGAGDCLAGAMIASILRGDDPHTCVKAGLHAAFLSLQTQHAVSDQICPEKFTVENIRDWMTWSSRDIAV